MEIRAIDNFLLDNDFNQVLMYCKNATYSYGEVDVSKNNDDESFCVGMVHQMYPITHLNGEDIKIKNYSKVFDLLSKECKSQFPEINECVLTRMYINCFSPRENPYFHIDSMDPTIKSYTCLLYANSGWDIDDGGETQFYVNDIIYGVPPVPNRMVLFDGRIRHRATTFRNKYRFTIALKYEF